MNSIKLIEKLHNSDDVINAAAVAKAIGKHTSFAKAWVEAKKQPLVAFRIGEACITTVDEANRFLMRREFISKPLPPEAFDYVSKRFLPRGTR